MKPAKQIKKTILRLPRRASLTPISIKPFEDQLPKLKAIAASEGVDVSDVLRAAFDMVIEAHEVEGELEKA